MQDLFKEFDPHHLSAAPLETQNKTRVLTVLDVHSSQAGILDSLNLLTACQVPLCWILYHQANTSLNLDQLESLLANAPEELELLLIQADDSSDGLNQIMAASTAYLDFSFFSQPPLAPFQALAMNLPVFLRSDAQLGTLPHRLIHLLELHSSHAANQLLEPLTGFNPLNLRSALLADLIEKEQVQVWLNQQAECLAEQFWGMDLAAIVFWGRSGSVFLNSLLDFHPEVITMGAGHFASITSFGQLWTGLIERHHTQFGSMLDVYCDLHRKQDIMQERKDEYVFDADDPLYEASFKRIFHLLIQKLGEKLGAEALSQDARKVFFIALHGAYYLSKGFKLEGRKVIVFQQHWSENVMQLACLCQDFPELKLLGMIRHPVRGYYSMLASTLDIRPGLSWPDLVLTGSYLQTWRHILMGWRLAETLLGRAVYGITLEQLHASPESTMRELAQYLNISWHPNLLNSTIDGVPLSISSGVHGKIDQRSETFSVKRANYEHWREHIGEWEHFVLEALLADVFEKYYNRKIPAFQRALSLVLMFLPHRLEWLAFQQALKARDEMQLKILLLNICERWYYSLLLVCGFAFWSHGVDRRLKAQELLGIKQS